jgi:hypothetical protein
MALLRAGRKLTVTVLALGCIGSLAAAQAGSLSEPVATFYLLPTRGWEMLIGGLISLQFVNRSSSWTQSERATGAIDQFGSLLGVVLIAAAVFMFDDRTPFPGLYALLPTAGAALIILCGNARTLVGRVLGSRLLVGIGLVSYSLYLWHQPLFAFARYRNPEIGWYALLFLSGLAGALAYLSWRYVERPFRDRNWIDQKGIFAFGLGGSILLSLFGWVGHVKEGFPERYDPKDRSMIAPAALHDSYVWGRFSALRLKDFDPNGPRKILIIGDSYSGDLVNALYEAGLNGQLQISTHTVSATCGNLYGIVDLPARVAPKDRAFCREENWYADERLQELMKQADGIWLASSWKYWQAELLPQSKENLEREFGRKVLVFGRKEFGTINLRRLISMPDEQRIELQIRMGRMHSKTNALMASTIADGFVDVSKLLCGHGDRCHPFTKEGKLISFDGGHLTKDGARHYGQKLSESAEARKLMGFGPGNL